MSLILEALKKLEREKQTPDRGFVVLAPVPWASQDHGRSFLTTGLTAGAVLALAGLGIAAYAWLARSAEPARTAAAAPSQPVPEPTRIPPEAGTPLAQTPAQRETRRRPAAPAAGTTRRVGQEPASLAPPETRPQPLPADAPAPDSQDVADPAPDTGSGADLVLQAISARDGKPVAMINERMLFEGDSFGDVRIVRIGAAEVEVEVRGTRRVLTF